MKYKMLLFFLFAIGNCAVANNADLERFKVALYWRQRGLMSEERYYKFIDPYIKEAEESLDLVKYGVETEKLCFSYMGYFDKLLAYNVGCFHFCVGRLNKDDLEKVKRDLLQLIKQVKDDANLHDLNVEEEFNKTVELFERANSAFYRKLNRLKFFLIRFFS